MPVFLDGFLVGLALIILIGPVFFTLLKTSLQHGIFAGSLVAFGIFVSDIIAVLLCAYGASPYLQNEQSKFYLSIAGGVILVLLGIKYFLKNNHVTDDKIELKASHYFIFFAKGFLVNFVNPFVFLVWIGIITIAGNKYGFDDNLGIYLSGTLLAILICDMSKVLLASKIKKFLRPDILVKLYKVIGVCLVLLGIRLLYYAF